VANCFATDQSSPFVEASLGTNLKANTSKGWKRIAAVSSVSAAYPKRIRQRDGNSSTAESSVSVAYRLRIQIASTVRSGSARQTDRLWFDYDCRFGSLEASNGPVASTVLLATTTGGNGSSTGFKGAGNSRNRLNTTITTIRNAIDRSNDDCGFGRCSYCFHSLHSSKHPLNKLGMQAIDHSQLAEAS
jgi:hypothetical protein